MVLLHRVLLISGTYCHKMGNGHPLRWLHKEVRQIYGERFCYWLLVRLAVCNLPVWRRMPLDL